MIAICSVTDKMVLNSSTTYAQGLAYLFILLCMWIYVEIVAYKEDYNTHNTFWCYLPTYSVCEYSTEVILNCLAIYLCD